MAMASTDHRKRLSIMPSSRKELRPLRKSQAFPQNRLRLYYRQVLDADGKGSSPTTTHSSAKGKVRPARPRGGSDLSTRATRSKTLWRNYTSLAKVASHLGSCKACCEEGAQVS